MGPARILRGTLRPRLRRQGGAAAIRILVRNRQSHRKGCRYCFGMLPWRNHYGRYMGRLLDAKSPEHGHSRRHSSHLHHRPRILLWRTWRTFGKDALRTSSKWQIVLPRRPRLAMGLLAAIRGTGAYTAYNQRPRCFGRSI